MDTCISFLVARSFEIYYYGNLYFLRNQEVIAVSKNRELEQLIPNMLELRIEDVFPIVLGVPSDEKGIIIYEEETIESGWSLTRTHQA